jgi:DegV family protein with EDD domain
MSGTFDSMNIALEELSETYPNRKVYTIDTKGISILSYIIVKEVAKLYNQGKMVEEILKWANEEVDHYAVYFYADDLKFFQRSGRVSNFSAIMGSLIGIHPILNMGSDGIMRSISKARGKKNTLVKILDYVIELEDDIKDYNVVIGHSDALDIAKTLDKMLKEKFGDDLNTEIIWVNPTAGSHCGPSNVGVTFHSKRR